MPVAASICVTQLPKLPNGCNPLLADVAHVGRSADSGSRSGAYAASPLACSNVAWVTHSPVFRVRYRAWRSNIDKQLHLISAEGSEAFEALPTAIGNLGPWAGWKEGEVSRLRLPLRSLLIDQGFVIVYAHESKLDIEIPTGTHGLHPANTECADCKGSGQVDQHGGLRQKSCWRCAGRAVG
jgi:hypothetical protein